jgi:tRNA (guanine-N7-)-methyltransferase
VSKRFDPETAEFHHAHIRTFKPRRGRVTQKQNAALANLSGPLITVTDELLEFDTVWPGIDDVVLEIGFGTGTATVAMAMADRTTGLLAIDVHTPGVGELLHRIDEEQLSQVRVIEGDAVVVLKQMIPAGSLAGVRLYFPDPWPKARHHKRRIVQPEYATLLATLVRPGGFWHLATDIADYAEQMLEVLSASPEWSGGVIERPSYRPITKYESIAIEAGRPITDLLYTRV